ncbi:MAG: hypothetical protein F4Z62_07520, partial [Rhodothermaceae bacterium]|nr:hypothetical protein [Rhodothermaceae bacterium]MXW32938.1 hypothetical protein [Rhodothermaceae bacterium]
METAPNVYLFVGRNRFRVCIRHILNFVGFWVLFFPVVVLGQTHAPQSQVHTGVTAPRTLLNTHLQAVEKLERKILVTPLLSAEPRTAPFEAIRASGGELSLSGPLLILPHFPHRESSSGIFVSSTNPGGFVDDWSSDFKQMPGDSREVEVTINNDDLPVIRFIVDEGTITEPLPDDLPAKYCARTIVDRAPPEELLFYYTTQEGTAKEGEDLDYRTDKYTLFTVKAIPPNLGYRRCIGPAIFGDFEKENDETMTVTLAPGTGYKVGSPSTHTVIIKDREPTVYFSLAKSSVLEDKFTHKVKVFIVPVPATDLTFSYRLDGTAERGEDYNSSGSFMVDAHKTSAIIPVEIRPDTEDEQDETVILTLVSGPGGYAVGERGIHTLTIVDDDDADVEEPSTVELSLSPASISEDGGRTMVTATVDPPSSAEITVTVS